MWWWVLTRPGVTRQPDASMVSAAAGAGSVDAPTPDTRPPVIATHPPASSRPSSSHVATSLALRTSRSAVGSAICTPGFRAAIKSGHPTDSPRIQP